MNDYASVMGRRGEIMKKAVGMDYGVFEEEGLSFDYEALMEAGGYSFEDVRSIQRSGGIGDTPLLELSNLSRLMESLSPAGKGGRIFLKDEAVNPSGSYKVRRAATSVYHAKKKGYKGVIAATSGNYGAAVASQAAVHGLKCIILQECYDSRRVGQPEIVEKARKCEAFGAEVIQLTVGPELFYTFLLLLEETGYFNASLYTSYGVRGVETLGVELVQQVRQREGRDPDYVVCTNAGGGNLTGTARGMIRMEAKSQIIAASVDLTGLHMASDRDFNRKSFTTGHTGFGIPFTTRPDRSDVPRSAARPLRYLDRYLSVKQGEVFYITEALAQLEGIERGPAGNTSLAAACALAREVEKGRIIVVQESEYTGAGKHIQAQLAFAREQGIEIRFGNPEEEVPGKSIILPASPELVALRDLDLGRIRRSYLKNALALKEPGRPLSPRELRFLQGETRLEAGALEEALRQLGD